MRYMGSEVEADTAIQQAIEFYKKENNRRYDRIVAYRWLVDELKGRLKDSKAGVAKDCMKLIEDFEVL